MNPNENRLHALDAVRGFALLLGVAFHAALSFMPGWPPGIWAMVDNSPSQFLSDAGFVAHIFRMSLFFFIAGFFARMMFHKRGAGGFWVNRAKRIAVPLVVGWVVLFPLIMWVWSLGLNKVFNGQVPPMPEFPRPRAPSL
jgi:peptidoglycan/LPS O-acetylase OafA/YrhL